MARNDIKDFLYFITHNKNMSHDQLVLRDRLLYNDIKNGRIDALKQEEKPKSERKSVSPYDTASFLAQFNEPSGFKFLTHDFNDITDSSLPHTAKELKIQVDKILREKKYNIPGSLSLLMRGFVDGSWEWIDYNGNSHKSSWAMQSWQDWSVNHPQNPHPIHDKLIKCEIETFRATTRLVAPNLETWIDNIKENYNLKISTSNINTADFYTNTYQLWKAFKTIFGMMEDKSSDFSEVFITYKEDISLVDRKGTHVITIIQKGSFSNKEFESVFARMSSKDAGNLGTIRSYLDGYCHWQLLSKWNGKPVRWNILKEERTPDYEVVKDSDVTGFTHILTFYSVF